MQAGNSLIKKKKSSRGAQVFYRFFENYKQWGNKKTACVNQLIVI